jgi:hypothetical protein
MKIPKLLRLWVRTLGRRAVYGSTLRRSQYPLLVEAKPIFYPGEKKLMGLPTCIFSFLLKIYSDHSIIISELLSKFQHQREMAHRIFWKKPLKIGVFMTNLAKVSRKN